MLESLRLEKSPVIEIFHSTRLRAELTWGRGSYVDGMFGNMYQLTDWLADWLLPIFCGSSLHTTLLVRLLLLSVEVVGCEHVTPVRDRQSFK